jgi:hypothetical protein
MDSIFPSVNDPFDRGQIKWEDYIYALTPVEKHGKMYFKREDKFAPLGYHSVNGAKMRQCLWLVNDWVKNKRIKGVVSGSVVGSPQHPFISSVCKHYGIGCLIITGSKNYDQHKNMQLAIEMGAKFKIVKVTYSRALNSLSFKYAKLLDNHEVLETNITVADSLNTPDRIEAFHSVGAHQTKNIPDHIETIIIPVGSANSVVSVLYGLFNNRPKNLKRILLMGIGNNGSYNLKYVPNRLSNIGKVINKDINKLFDWSFIGGGAGLIKIEHHNLNGSQFCKYDDWMPYTLNDIEFHPRYEGKIFNYMKQNESLFEHYFNDKTLFWIVGNEPKFVKKHEIVKT